MRKVRSFTYPSTFSALSAVASRNWYVVQGRDMYPSFWMRWARTAAERKYWPDQSLRSQPVTIRKWLRRATAVKETGAMFVGELVLADGTTLKLAEIDQRRARKQFNLEVSLADWRAEHYDE